MESIIVKSLIFSSITVVVFSQSPQVSTTLGVIAGETINFKEDSYLKVDKNIDVYKGIPFAEPPVGEYRFEKPRPKKPWDGTLDATEYGASCLNFPSPAYLAGGKEDCLYLNIFSAQTKPENAAVMVFIHGGAFLTGTASLEIYSGMPLAAAGDVIIITINYRLNFFGFLTTDDEDYPGNMGLFDQQEALKWVNSHIGAFGGDPSRVTIFGESAGSASVDYHLLSKGSWTYFSQAILESGTTLSPWASIEREVAAEVTIEIGKKVGCEYTESKAFVSCMKWIDAGAILNASVGMTVVPIPVVDGLFLEDSPEVLITNGEIKRNATIIVGTNEDEGTYLFFFNPVYSSPYTPNLSKAEFLQLIPTLLLKEPVNPLITDSIDFEYTDWSSADNPDADYFNSTVQLTTDSQFLCPSDVVQRAHSTAGNNVYVYLMTHVPTVSVFSPYIPMGVGFDWLRAGHGEELQFVFGLPFLPNASMYQFEQPNDVDRNVSVEFVRYWTNFAKTGDPNSRGSETPDPSFDIDLVNWPKYTIPELQYLDINTMSYSDRAYRADKCAFWNSYEPKLEQYSADLPEQEKFWRDDYYNWKNNDLPEWRKAFDDYQQNNVCN
ncbi:acetylcholinesterase-like [Antedon mediterranea]|uniref:acetylcholinesterase-like n=1 Tax=Antedon mediterranea TaxID=105859 RepID=UPI003AF43EEA